MSTLSGSAPREPAVAGRLTSVYGIKGWVKVYSHTQPRENLLSYSPWWVKTPDGGWTQLNIDQHRDTSKGLLVHIEGIDDRDEARLQCQRDIYIEKADMPALPNGEFYWHQLLGLSVKTTAGCELGKVTDLLETGANDVLVVQGEADSIDQRERLIPYIDAVVLNVDIEAAVIEVDWDIDF